MAVIITEFQLDEFHGGNPLRVLDLGNGLNVALVRDEAGRMQLLQLVPWVLYGPGDYFASSEEFTAPGNRGALTVRTDHGVFSIDRPWFSDADADGDEGLPTLTGSDGERFESDYLANILEGLPGPNYREVFTFDLARLSHFARGGEGASQLISLANYLKDKSPRSAVTSPVAAPPPDLTNITSRLGELTSLVHSSAEIAHGADGRGTNGTRGQNGRRSGSREKLRQQLKKLEGDISASRAKWNQLQKEVDEIQCVSVMARLQTQLRRVKRDLKEARADKTARKFAVNEEAAARLEDKLDSIRSELKEHKSEAEDLKRQGRELGDLGRTQRLVPQIDALLIQEKSLVKEEAACDQLEDKIRDLEMQIESERLRPAAQQPIVASLSSNPADVTSNARLDQISERLRESQRELDIAEDRYQRAQQANHLAENRLRQSTSLTQHPEDAVAIHEAQNRVIGLKEILGLDNQLLRLEEDREDLQLAVNRLYAGQMMPFRMTMALGIPFMIGVAMIIWGLVMTPPVTNWRLVVLGFMAALITSMIKISMDQGTRDSLQAARSDLSRVNYQIDEIFSSRDESAVSGVSVQRQLEEAERDLARLQQRFASRDPEPQPLSVGADPGIESARMQWELAQQRQVDLAGQWRELMIELGLSPNFDLTQARESLKSRSRVTNPQTTTTQRNDTTQLEFQLQHYRHDLDRRRDWLNGVSGQTRQLISELGLSGTVKGIGEQVDVLREALSEYKERSQMRREISRSLKRVKEKIRRLKEAGRRATEQRAKLDEEVKLNEQRAKSELKARKLREKELAKDRERLEMELNDIRSQYNVQSKSNLAELAELNEDEIAHRNEGLARQSEKAQDQLLKLSEQRGRCRAELNALDDDRQESDIPWHAILEKAQQISQECELTESTAQTVMPMSQAKYAYLEQASEYLQHLSGGQFWQIDSPHDQDLLLTDNAGNVMRLADVSPDHYANIYFSLWLARLEAYADQGLRLPIIMEDPLEATDPQRKPVIATLLRDIAAKGHQVVLITSDSFNASIFSQCDVPIADLSDRMVVTTSDVDDVDRLMGDLTLETAVVEDSRDPDEPLFPPS